MGELRKVNRKIKAAMKIFIKNEDDGALKSMTKLIKQREEILKNINKDISDV